MWLTSNDFVISHRPESRTFSPSEADCNQGKKMESEKKRRKYSTSSNDSDTTDSQVTSWSRSSKNTGTSSTWVRLEHKKPSEVSHCQLHAMHNSLVSLKWHLISFIVHFFFFSPGLEIVHYIGNNGPW
ncbi:unnamed protein product [Oncorhynchus mykiss]|uniref:Uncharacterized protein n=1 Tax=Oncorhynchus mykiss TaxID=8022 RepID=A0A060X9K9_ONCMY|nr:unnamed protein product [Oncorhynchus mykiss]